jgi:hypothetical protein
MTRKKARRRARIALRSRASAGDAARMVNNQPSQTVIRKPEAATRRKQSFAWFFIGRLAGFAGSAGKV